jgi:hypothetical protein
MKGVVHASAAFLRVLAVPLPQHLLTDAGTSTGRPQTDGGIRGDGGIFSVWKSIRAIRGLHQSRPFEPKPKLRPRGILHEPLGGPKVINDFLSAQH